MIALSAATGRPVPTFGKDGIVDLKLENDQTMDLDHRRDRAPRRADHRQRRRRHRRGPSAGRRAQEPAERERLRSRIRRADRQAPLDLSHHPAARRVRQRHVAEGFVGLHRQHGQLGTDVRRRGTGPCLSRDRDADRRLLRRASARQQPVRRQHRGAGCQDGQADLVLPDDPPRHLGLGPSLPRRSSATSRSTDRQIKALAQPSKQGFLYVFDRTNGQPVWPIEERPVAKGDVPGEWYSPTQPFPTKPPAYERQGVSIDDLIDFTPELRAEAVKVAANYKMGPIFTPPVVSQWPGPLGTLMSPAGDRRHELAGRIVRSRDRHVLRLHELVGQRAGSHQRSEAIGHGLHFGPGARSECASAGGRRAGRRSGGGWR